MRKKKIYYCKCGWEGPEGSFSYHIRKGNLKDGGGSHGRLFPDSETNNSELKSATSAVIINNDIEVDLLAEINLARRDDLYALESRMECESSGIIAAIEEEEKRIGTAIDNRLNLKNHPRSEEVTTKNNNIPSVFYIAGICILVTLAVVIGIVYFGG